MAKHKSAMTARSGAETASRGRVSAAQGALPGLAKPEQEPSAPLGATRRRGRGATPSAQLQVVSNTGPSQPPRTRRQPEPTPTPTASPASPKRPRQSSSRRFGDLRDALADGWEIVQPIFARPLWSAADDSQTAFNFVLHRDQATRLLTVPSNRTVERFIASHSFQVDYRR